MAEVLLTLHAAGGHPQSHQNMKYHSLIMSHSWHYLCGPACRLDWPSRSSLSQLAKIYSSFDVSTFCSRSELEQNQILRFPLWTGNVTFFLLFVTLAGWLWDRVQAGQNQRGPSLTSITSGQLYCRTLSTSPLLPWKVDEAPKHHL